MKAPTMSKCHHSNRCLVWEFVLLVLLLEITRVDSFYLPAGDYYCHPEDVCPPCPACPEQRIKQVLLRWFLHWSDTVEVLARSFALGFGLRMLKYILWEDSRTMTVNSSTAEEANNSSINDERDPAEIMLRALPSQMKIASISGLSMSALIFGLSLFLPTNFRSNWFQDHSDRV
ncbi:expressed unknown protein [Seminavis robusta]|uniref:Uncharacterized protein n=1 Tax=Seminavis robusta TaxID=568900 RepID=A0A9N8EG74_9STRA|nr:expressed unknown protein [Seminavis robusta]|eukprot:Sro1049_g235360.1 n/a (174) ;mRNA; r:11525-12257